MKAIVDAKEFAQALNKVTKVIKQAAVPVLEGVLVQIKDGRCTLTASDWTTWLTTAIPAEGDDLSFVFQRPKDAARACGHFEGELILETEEKSNDRTHWLQLTMSCGPRTAQMDAFPSEDYPDMLKEPTRYTYTVNAARLLERVEHVRYTLRKPDGKLEAKFTHVQFGGSKVFALDGYRMACDVDDSLTVRQPFMILPEALGHLKFFGDREITASMGKNYLRMTDGTTMVQTQIEGPLVFNVDGAVPKNFAEEFYISPKEFLGELDYLKKLARSTDKAYIGFSGGRLYLSTASGSYSTQVQVDGASSIDFGFDLRYMLDALRQFRGEPAVKMKVNSSVAPIILEAEGRGDFAMVLPVRVKAAVKAA
jgi:DNA polymerase III sliding clamp (beta) subunit (PCNA family)